MNKLYSERMMAKIEGDFVVFLIGMKINKPWKIHKWWPVFSAMSRMIKELEQNPELGMLGYISGTKLMVQYWKSFDHLEAYARSKDSMHLPAWKAFNDSVGKSRGDVGIWHETYQVRAGEYEAVYSGMPLFGLGSAGRLLPATGAQETARGRLTTEKRADA
ncbi:DUF4188 domain-containing protein [Halomonas sp. M5N1S17]|uniref:DUF4188 domain-containing protein n=1 Tax=Halomonas alkalisoli TaxID=2907158 RepID=UPI001F4008BE|nr:DUF4188 domain-containing protein [Halomonas alkalisoli]MCE9664809.1 DUF4188 domain-containing protein [Halomonas alkalisoli]